MFETKKEKQLAQTIVNSLVRSMFEQGVIKEEDLASPAIMRKRIADLLERKTEFGLIVDHRDDVLKQANQFVLRGQFEYAKVFYATFFEHSINSVISTVLSKKNINTKSKNEIIKSLPISAKFGWLLDVLDLPTFNNLHRKTIASTADSRNAFIHYKFNPDPDSDKIPDLQKKEKEIADEIARIKQCVKYMKSYESKITYSGKKLKLEAAIKNLASKNLKSEKIHK